MFRSIRWKFIIIYFMLVFIAMIISGVFVIKYLEQYQLGIITNQLNALSEQLVPQLSELDSLEERQDEVRRILSQLKALGFREEIYVISAADNRILATSTDNVDRSALDVLDDGYRLYASSLNGTAAEGEFRSGQLRTKDIAQPILNNGKLTGVLYLRYDLSDTYKTIDKSKRIIIQATFLALFITILLSYVIAKSVTEPINAVTEKAYKMARGDFNQQVDVRSDDEIGKLAEMFNNLTGKLNSTLGEMSREKSKLETILNYMADGLVAVNDAGGILHINPKACDIFGLTPADSGSADFNRLIGSLNPELEVAAITAVDADWIGSGRIESGEAVYTVNYAPFKNESGDKKGLVYVFQDITEQYRLDRMRREFVANVSHELKTPLTSIKSYTETLLDGMMDEPDTARHFLKVVDHEADRMTRLVRDLLQLSNFDANIIQFDWEYHDYVDLMRKIVSKFEVTARNRQQQLTLETQLGELVGYFDYDRIEQVVQNVVSNALKYTPEGGQVTLRVTRDEEQLHLEIQDTGIGIPESDIDRIFERFYRVDKARSRNLGGTGLGLSIAREIILAHNGTIEIESRVHEGTCVRIRIPLELT